MARKSTQNVTYAWQGKDKSGRKIKGEMQGNSIALVKAELRKQKIVVTRVRKKSSAPTFGRSKVTAMDVTLFTRQLATMTKAGVPLLQAFDIASEGIEKPAMKELVSQLKKDISGGSTFADALRKHPRHFDELYCNLIASGEQSGALETLLDRIATYKEKTEALKAKIKKATKYPIAVVSVALIVTGILLIYVVPQFEEVFQGFGAELPAFTQLVIGLSESIQQHWLTILMTLIACIYLTRRMLRNSKSAKNSFDRLVLRLPIIGNILHKSAVARFARTLSTTFSAGVPLVDALESVAGAAGNIVYYQAVQKIREDVSNGQQLQFSMRNSSVFPTMSVQMVAIGEESGSLDEMLDKVASFYENEVDNSVDGLTSLMEPMIMSVLGVLVGGLIIAMYLPIFQLGSVV